jgi:hypothetical protein
MIKIKFSHKYAKNVHVGKRTTYLIGVSKCNISALPKEFIHWDTLYVDNRKICNYKLPEKGIFMVLTLCTPASIANKNLYPFQIWTTIRRWTPSKEKYYEKEIGKQVEIAEELKC